MSEGTVREMSEQEILESLREILRDSSAEARDWEGVDADTEFQSLGIDSLSILDLLYDIDQVLGVQLEGSDVVDLRTVGELTALLKQRGA